MGTWISCGTDFIVGDVVRWKENVLVAKGKRKRKLVKVGERRVTAEVTTVDGTGWVHLSVCACEILANLAARSLEPYRKGEIVRRARRTIGRGGGERLEWQPESARSVVASRFLAGR